MKKRDPAQISNDISEGMPVTKAELLEAFHWVWMLHDAQVERVNRLKDTMLKAILTDQSLLDSPPLGRPKQRK